MKWPSGDGSRVYVGLENADKAAVIIDACDYYRIVRQAMLEARHRVLIIGWDFDPRIVLDRTNSDQSLGDFLAR